MKNDKLEQVCTHPKVPSPDKQVAKCALCMKPLGRDHMVTVDSKSFCCNAAADQFFASNQHYEGYLQREKKGRFARLVKKVAVLIILLAILGGVYVMFGEQIMDKINDFRGITTEETTPDSP